MEPRVKRNEELHARLAHFFFVSCGTPSRPVLLFNYKRNLGKDGHMKKQKNSQKLTLSRQTLRRLESPQLAQVVGGTVVTCVPTQCTTGFAFSGANC